MDYEIIFPTFLSEIDDPTNDNIDVCVRSLDGKEYTFVFVTPDFLNSLMEKENEVFIHPSFKFIVVKEISENTILAAIKEIVNDPSLLLEFGMDR